MPETQPGSTISGAEIHYSPWARGGIYTVTEQEGGVVVNESGATKEAATKLHEVRESRLGIETGLTLADLVTPKSAEVVPVQELAEDTPEVV